MRRLLVLFLFLLSGAAGLIYQIVWMRQLTLIVGVTSQAVSTVLAVFMGGLALGSWLLGRGGDDTRSPLRLYGWLELGIALFGAQSLLLLRGIETIYVPLKEWSLAVGLPFPLVRATLAGLALLGPTTLMGATLPVLVRGACRTRSRVAREAGLLYGINTLGAVAGTLAAAFWLVQHLGIRATTLVAVGINAFVGIAALLLARREGAVELEEEEDVGDADELESESRGTARLVMLAFGASGFLALAYEVLWTRYLIYVVGENSVYAFASMLASFLLGIALGSFFASLIADRVRNRVGLLGAVLVLLGAAAAGTVGVMGFVATSEPPRMGTMFWADAASYLGRSLLVLIVPTTLSGMTFAIVARVVARDLRSLGADAGRAYAVNTLGAILGALAGGFLILPRLGLERGLLVCAAVSVVVGLALCLWRAREGRAVVSAVLTGALAIAAFVGAERYGKTPRELLEAGGQGTVLAYWDGPESSVAVGEDSPGGDRWIAVDGEVQSGTDPIGQVHLRLLGHLPALFHPDPKRALVVAYGGGITTGCVLQHPIEHLDQVELNPIVLDHDRGAAWWFTEYNHDPTHDPRFHAHADDGRNFLLASDETWDVITSDPIDPNDAGTTSLYCVEYYELVREHLNPGGVACQWITAGYGEEDFGALIRSFQKVFPYTSIWNAQMTTVVVGFVDEPQVSLGDLRAKFEIESVRDSLAVVGIDSAETLMSLLLTGPDETRSMIGEEGPLNTDDRPRIEYYRGGFSKGWVEDWRALYGNRTADHSDWLAGWSEADAAALAPSSRWMDMVASAASAELDPLAAELPGELGLLDLLRQSEVEAADLDEQVLAGADLREQSARLALDELWQLLAHDVPPVYVMMTGVARPGPPDEATPEQRSRVATALRTGREMLRAGDFEGAALLLRAAADEVPGSDEAHLLAVSARDRAGDTVGALAELLDYEISSSGWSDHRRQFAERLVPCVFLDLRDLPAAEAAALGGRLAELMPRDADRPVEPPSGGWMLGGSEWPPRARPNGDALGDVDSWRLWWGEAGWALKVANGRFEWRYE